ncbi:MAG: O-antigen ligase family protein [Acidaminococcaceae bacterium]|nr:O-antigen ligase family protein [Acidaminococcaceae bacterium]
MLITKNVLFKINFQVPNLLSVVWLLLCLNIFFLVEKVYDNVAFYCVIGLVCFASLIKYINKKRFTKFEARIIKAFTLLFLLQILGLLNLFTSFSLRTIAASICVFCFIDTISTKVRKVQPLYFRFAFYPIFIYVLNKSFIGLGAASNTIPGCMVFLTLSYLLLEHNSYTEVRSVKFKMLNSISLGRDVMLLVLTALICYKSSARTALFVLLGSLLVFILLYFFTKSQFKIWRMRSFFWITIGILFFLMYLLMNFQSFLWYNDINQYSLQYFGKNLDSSRGLIWSYSYDSLSLWQVLIGAGTGMLPNIEGRYVGSSFHNSYFQLFMQNGLLGLSCLIFVLWTMWKSVTAGVFDTVQKYVIAIFIGVIIYNCFEVTLLQNKTFLGVIQWFALSIGVTRTKWVSDQKIAMEKSS